MDGEGTELVETYDYLFKFIVIGKSCLLYQFINDDFKENSAHTIGVEFSSRTIRIGDRNIKLQPDKRGFDLLRDHTIGAPPERYLYTTLLGSFERLDRWLADCRALASPHLAVVLVGNKLDREEDRVVSYDEGERWARENAFIETSSRSGENTHAAFITAAHAILSAIDSGELDPNASGTGVSYGERQLRAVASDHRLGSVFRRGAKKKERQAVDFQQLVDPKRPCSC